MESAGRATLGFESQVVLFVRIVRMANASARPKTAAQEPHSTRQNEMALTSCSRALHPQRQIHEDRGSFQSRVGDCKKVINLVRSSADASPPYGFMLLPGATSSGFAMKPSSFSLSHTKSAPFIALE
jgi:hypothetical protein